MLSWTSPSRHLVAATVFSGCALLLASAAMRSRSKPALPELTDPAEANAPWIAEAHGGTEEIAIAGFAETDANTVVCALLLPPDSPRE